MDLSHWITSYRRCDMGGDGNLDSDHFTFTALLVEPKIIWEAAAGDDSWGVSYGVTSWSLELVDKMLHLNSPEWDILDRVGRWWLKWGFASLGSYKFRAFKIKSWVSKGWTHSRNSLRSNQVNLNKLCTNTNLPGFSKCAYKHSLSEHAGCYRPSELHLLLMHIVSQTGIQCCCMPN